MAPDRFGVEEEYLSVCMVPVPVPVPRKRNAVRVIFETGSVNCRSRELCWYDIIMSGQWTSPLPLQLLALFQFEL